MFHKVVSIFEHMDKCLQLTFWGRHVYHELYSCCKFIAVFIIIVIIIF